MLLWKCVGPRLQKHCEALGMDPPACPVRTLANLRTDVHGLQLACADPAGDCVARDSQLGSHLLNGQPTWATLVAGLSRNGVRADWRQGPYAGDKELAVARKDLPRTKSLLRSWRRDFVAQCMGRS